MSENLPDLPDNVDPGPEPLIVFQTFERLETTTGLQVTRENMLDIAEHFGWSVEFQYSGGALKKTPVLSKDEGLSRTIRIGEWITENGHTRPSGTGSRSWYPAGSHVLREGF